MSTSLAIQPAYPGSKAERSKANPDRTIFGTTLDNYGRCWNLLKDPKVQESSDKFYFEKLGRRWIPRSANSQRIHNSGWGLTDYTQPEIAEEFVRHYDLRNCWSAASNTEDRLPELPTSPYLEKRGNLVPSSACSKYFQRCRKRTMSAPNEKTRRPVRKIPKFRLPPNTFNPMRLSSLKITETGAKDLINAKNVNEIGLDGTLQFNHQAHQQRQVAPMFYKHHGSALTFGQYFSNSTTNKDVTAPGGYYRMDTADLQTFKAVGKADYRPTEATIQHKQPRKEHSAMSSTDLKITPSEIPLNIRHKFGSSNIKRLLNENHEEVCAVLQREAELNHSGMVPARKTVKELNHPINPPVRYFTNYGGNLKYDEFEGGLHLYIK
uniref:Uncharacterized LOC100184747 n=1 Tax=Ciona intestinalis TaxID=7719 RepID=H2XZW0_CIOIN|nr:uncharacterized protein LOC100184747 isoform X2 [Ciona intestinalis]|eukprot:XP_002130089.1 uncharacterized protein LOC100184747 isoform X2 [Ciona intestinalis]